MCFSIDQQRMHAWSDVNSFNLKRRGHINLKVAQASPLKIHLVRHLARM